MPMAHPELCAPFDRVQRDQPRAVIARLRAAGTEGVLYDPSTESDFGAALQGFTKMLGAPGEDGVFRYEPPPVEENLPKPEDDSEEVAEWFSTETDPAIAQAVAKAEAEARAPVQGAIGSPAPNVTTPVQYSQQTQQPIQPQPPAPGRHSGNVEL